MKTVIIYPTAIKVSEGMTLDDLTVVDGFEELLDNIYLRSDSKR